MNDILEEFENYISSNKEVLSILPVNTKKNRSKYLEKVDEFLDKAFIFYNSFVNKWVIVNYYQTKYV